MDLNLFLQKVSAFQTEPQSSANAATHIENSSMSHIDSPIATHIASPLNNGESDAIALGNYLKRKVRLGTFTVEVGTKPSFSLRPWDLFLSDPAIAKKVDNYNLLKGGLTMEFHIAGTPFHRGMFLASYQYFDRVETISPTATDIANDLPLIRRSQRPHIWLNSSTNKTGCICVPFLHPNPFGSTGSPDISWSQLGVLNIDAVGSGLQQINAGTDAITINVFAYMVDPVLAAPTAGLLALSGDASFMLEPQSEYATSGIISGPASAIANAAGLLSSVPYIGPFALATNIGASAVSSIAKLFGFSKPSMIDDLKPVRNTPVSNLALTEGKDASQKMTVTGKCELTIDPSTVGMAVEDNLALYYYTKKESFFGVVDWNSDSNQGATIVGIEVSPMLEGVSNNITLGASRYFPTSLSMVSTLFTEWSGSLKYRFQIIGSQYHRGKIGVIYDPRGSGTPTEPYVTNFNTIVDISETRDFTIEINWQQGQPYAPIERNTTLQNSYWRGGFNPFASRVSANGALYLVVLNELTVPDGISPVQIAMSISAGDDFELVNPSSVGLRVTYTEPQSGDAEFLLEPQSTLAVDDTPMEENAPESMEPPLVITEDVHTDVDHKSLMYYGERVTSMRQLFKRSTFYRRISYGDSIVNISSSLGLDFKALPILPGFLPDGVDETDLSRTYNYVGNSYFNHIRLAFAGWRGSMRYKFLPIGNPISMRATRRTGIERSLATNYTVTASTWSGSSGPDFIARNGMTQNIGSPAGTVATQNRTMDSLEIEVPYTVPLNFSLNKRSYLTAGTNTLANAYPGGDAVTFNYINFIPFNAQPVASAVDMFFATGEDVMLVGFIGAPPYAIQDIPLSA